MLQRCLADAGTNSTGQPCANGFVTITTVNAPTTTYSDTGLTGGIFNYRVQAVDGAGNVSLSSNTATASVPDVTAPSAPTNLTAMAATVANQISLSWGASTDNVGVTGYLVERCSGSGCVNFAQIATSTTTTYTDMGLAPGTPYNYQVVATDAAGNLAPSSIASATTPSLSAPSAPNLSVSIGTSSPIVVAMQELEDSKPVTSHTTAAFNSTGGNLIVLYAYSLAGVTFTPSDSFNNTWIPLAGPTSTASGADLRTQLWYAWNPIVGSGHTVTVAISTGQPLLMSVIVVQNANVSSPVDAVSLISSDMGSPTVNVASPFITTSATNDMLIGFAALSASATFTPGQNFTLQTAASTDVTAAETGPAATPGTYGATFTLSTARDWQSAVVAAANNPNQVALSWSTSTGGSGTILEYLVSRCQGPGCSNFALIGTTPGTTTSFNDTGLSASTSYTYQVQAEDTSFTLSAPSTPAGFVTAVPPPSLPGDLTVAAASSTQNNLSWSASLETGGGTIAKYLVESCHGPGCSIFNQIGTSPIPGYTDNTVTTGNSYTYRVRAQDTAGNVSPYSNVATDVTP